MSGLAGCIALLALSLTAYAVEDVPGPEGSLEEFNVVTADAEKRSAEIFEDFDLTILNIWGTYCGPCIREMPELAEFAGGLPERVQFMTLCIDASGQEGQVAAFLTKQGFEDPSRSIVAFDGDLVEMLGQVMYIPTTITIDSKGKILSPCIIGSPTDIQDAYTVMANEALEELSLPLLGEGAEADPELQTE